MVGIKECQEWEVHNPHLAPFKSCMLAGIPRYVLIEYCPVELQDLVVIALVSDQWPLLSVLLQNLDNYLLILQYNEDVLQGVHVAGF